MQGISRRRALLAVFVLMIVMTGIVPVMVEGAAAGLDNPYRNLEVQQIAEGDNFVNYYILHQTGQDQPTEGLIIYLDGSGLDSALGLQQDGGWPEQGLFIRMLNRYFSSRYDILVPEKTNVTPGKNHDGDPKALSYYTFQQRVDAAVLVIETFLSRHEYGRIFLVGASEGGFILPRVYRSLKDRAKITKLAILASGGLSQQEEFQIIARSPLDMPPEYRSELLKVDAAAAAIKADPDSLEKRYCGLTYRRWAGFLTYRPLDDLTAIDIPILMMHGEKDTSAPVESSRIVAVFFQKLGKTNLTYYEYPGGDHRFNGDFDTALGIMDGWFDTGRTGR